MALTFLNETNESILASIQTELSFIDKSIDLSVLEQMTVNRLNKELTLIQESIATMQTGVYGSWLHNEDYVRDTMLEEAIKIHICDRHDQMATEKLIPRSTYYTQVTTHDNIIEGHKAIYMGAKFSGWMKLYESEPVAKALQVLRHGTDEDFRELYIGIADGRSDALTELSMEHITKSSPEALAEMGAYCDSRWEGPWPWEIEAPAKLKYLIETREERNMRKINDLKQGFKVMIREFDEGTMNKFDLVTTAQEMQKRVDSMIADFGKLSSNGIEITAQVKASGDEQLIQPMQDALGEPLNNAVDALTTLKASLTKATNTIAGIGNGDTYDGDGDMGMSAGLGSPMDAMGDNPRASDDAIDNVDISGDDEERPRKEI